MRNYVLMCLFVSYVCYEIEALFLENLNNHDCREGDYFWNSCLECKCHNNHLGCLACGGKCAGKNIESHCSVGTPTTAAPVTHSGACDKLKVFEAVALMQFVHNDQGKRCGDGRSHDNDALVMTLCSAPSSSKWIDGEHVWRNNKCSPSIKPFTPIYFHEGDNKYPAIILSCSATEIKVLHQTCQDTPRVLHVTDPHTLSQIYAVTWI